MHKDFATTEFARNEKSSNVFQTFVPLLLFRRHWTFVIGKPQTRLFSTLRTLCGRHMLVISIKLVSEPHLPFQVSQPCPYLTIRCFIGKG